MTGVESAARDTARRGSSLRRHRDYRLLLSAAAASHVGTQMRLVALPLLAVTAFHATAGQTGLLVTAETVAFLAIG
ncbi:MFS transporter, partial [Streptomyces sp. W16]|nr:MFS transporter [Streptomyces sp. W16]